MEMARLLDRMALQFFSSRSFRLFLWAVFYGIRLTLVYNPPPASRFPFSPAAEFKLPEGLRSCGGCPIFMFHRSCSGLYGRLAGCWRATRPLAFSVKMGAGRCPLHQYAGCGNSKNCECLGQKAATLASVAAGYATPSPISGKKNGGRTIPGAATSGGATQIRPPPTATRSAKCSARGSATPHFPPEKKWGTSNFRGAHTSTRARAFRA